MVPSSRAHVVHDLHAFLQRLDDDGRLPRVDGNGNFQPALEPAQYGKNARQFHLGADRLRARACRFAAEVEDIGAFGFQFQGAIKRLLGVEIAAAVGKRIGRDIQNAEQKRAFLPFQSAGAEFPGASWHVW